MKKLLKLVMCGVMVSSLVACSNTPSSSVVESSSEVSEESEVVEVATKFTAGTYEGVGVGRNGEIKVSVTFSDDAIENIVVTNHNETPYLSKLSQNTPASISGEMNATFLISFCIFCA